MCDRIAHRYGAYGERTWREMREIKNQASFNFGGIVAWGCRVKEAAVQAGNRILATLNKGLDWWV